MATFGVSVGMGGSWCWGGGWGARELWVREVLVRARLWGDPWGVGAPRGVWGDCGNRDTEHGGRSGYRAGSRGVGRALGCSKGAWGDRGSQQGLWGHWDVQREM